MHANQWFELLTTIKGTVDDRRQNSRTNKDNRSKISNLNSLS